MAVERCIYKMSVRTLNNIDEVMAFLLEFTDYEKITNYKYDLATFNLGRVEELLAAVGNPHHAFRSVHIAGTKGKGSTAAMVQSALMAAGLRAGCFTSPHLVRLEERMTVNGELMPEAQLTSLANELVSYTEQARRERPRESPTYFELVTALGFMHFARAGVDFAVVEVGMGGRLDATNVITPEVSVITRIDFDHVNRLGNTLAGIATEKGGIIKPGVPVVVAEQAPEAFDTLAAIARERGAPLVQVGRDLILGEVATGVRDDAPFCRFSVSGRGGDCDALELNLLGAHQASNAAAAIAAVEVLAERCGVDIDETMLRRGLAQARCPGRLEYFPGGPPVLLDGAHNPVSIKALCRALKDVFAGRRIILVMAVARDKDADNMLLQILPVVEHVIFTHTGTARCQEPEHLLARAGELGVRGAEVAREPEAALARARAMAEPNDLICITGSLYLAGKLRPPLLKPGISA